jgi:hypothetical protein
MDLQLSERSEPFLNREAGFDHPTHWAGPGLGPERIDESRSPQRFPMTGQKATVMPAAFSRGILRRRSLVTEAMGPTAFHHNRFVVAVPTKRDQAPDPDQCVPTPSSLAIGVIAGKKIHACHMARVMGTGEGGERIGSSLL